MEEKTYDTTTRQVYEFETFQKIPRISRKCIVTEKIDGTNAQILIGDNGDFLVGSRNRWITPGKKTDNSGFATWAYDHKEELMLLGPGRHYGEWWGQGIQRGYGLTEKRFSLFNTARWTVTKPPTCCGIVPVLYDGDFSTEAVDGVLFGLKSVGSVASPGFADPEGVVIYHAASRQLFKKTLDNDSLPKSLTVGAPLAISATSDQPVVSVT